jgi:hypothetical protein
MLQLGAVAVHPPIAIASAIAVASKSFFNKRTTNGAERLLNYMKQFTPKETVNTVVPSTSAASSNQALDQIQQ